MRLYPGALLRQAREKRQWSQEGLCSGICAVSYLSKIEQGKAEASPEILRLLFARLELAWYDDETTLSQVKELTERFYEALFSYDSDAPGQKAANRAIGILGEVGELRDKASGRCVKILSSQAGCMVYTGNWLSGGCPVRGSCAGLRTSAGELPPRKKKHPPCPGRQGR